MRPRITRIKEARRTRIRKAQSVIEYAILIGIVASAIMAMQFYIKRGAQGGIKKSVDITLGRQYVIDRDYSKPLYQRVLSEETKISQDSTNTISISRAGQETKINDVSAVESESRAEIEAMSDSE